MTQVHLLLNFDQKAKTLIDETMSVRLFTDRAGCCGHGIYRPVVALGRDLGLSENGSGHQRSLSQTLAGSRRIRHTDDSDHGISGVANLGLMGSQLSVHSFQFIIYIAVNGKL